MNFDCSGGAGISYSLVREGTLFTVFGMTSLDGDQGVMVRVEVKVVHVFGWGQGGGVTSFPSSNRWPTPVRGGSSKGGTTAHRETLA